MTTFRPWLARMHRGGAPATFTLILALLLAAGVPAAAGQTNTGQATSEQVNPGQAGDTPAAAMEAATDLQPASQAEIEAMRMAYLGDRQDIPREQAQLGFCVMYAALNDALRKEALQRIREGSTDLFFAAHADSGATPLSMAAQMGDPELVQALLDRKVPVDGVIAPNQDWVARGQTPLMAAVAGTLRMVPRWVQPGTYNPFHPARRAYQAHFPTDAQRLQVIQLLIKAGANVNAANANGYTPLMQALQLPAADEPSRLLRRKVALALIDAGADANAPVQPAPGAPALPEDQRPTLLGFAIQQNMSAVARALLAHGADPKAQHSIALFMAIGAGDFGDIDLMRMLLAKGADANDYSPFLKRRPLAVAVWTGRKDAARVLLDAKANPNACSSGPGFGKDCQGGPEVGTDATPLMAAVDAGNADMTRMLLAHGATRQPPNPTLPPMLWQVILHGKAAGMSVCNLGPEECSKPRPGKYDRLTMLRIAVDAGEDVNQLWSGELPLMKVKDDEPDVVTYLVEHGASYKGMMMPNGEAVGPITAALSRREPFKALALVRRSPTPLPESEQVALRFAAWLDQPELMQELLKHGMPVDGTGPMGATALHIAAAVGAQESVRLLLAAHADPNAQMNSAMRNRLRAIKNLGRQEFYTFIQAPDVEMTPLMLAAYFGYPEAVEALLKAGADRHLKSGDEKTAFMFAQEKHWRRVSAMLWEGRPGEKAPPSGVALVEKNNGQAIGDAWIVAQKKGASGGSTCVEVRVAKTDANGGIPRDWWPEYMGEVENVYKRGIPVSGSMQHSPDGLTWLPMDERMVSGNPSVDASSARIAQLNFVGGAVSCPGASAKQRRALFPMYKAMIAEAFSLASQPAQFGDAEKLCTVFYFASVDDPLHYSPLYGPDPKKDAFLKREAPQCMQPHGAAAQAAR